MADELDTIVVKEPSQTLTPNMDLSAQITATLDKRAGETVKCVRVFGDNYRCNWWVRADPAASPSARGLSMGGTIMRGQVSSFIPVIKQPNGLQLRDVMWPEC